MHSAGLEWNWLRNGYYIHNFFFLLTLLWCLQDKRSTEAVLIGATLDILGVLIDATCILISWDNGSIYGGTKMYVTVVESHELPLIRLSFVILDWWF